jgi:hypothetical protein
MYPALDWVASSLDYENRPRGCAVLFASAEPIAKCGSIADEIASIRPTPCRDRGAVSGPQRGRLWCGKGKNRIHLMMWIAKVQKPMRDDEGKLIRDKEGNLVWARSGWKAETERTD